VVSLTGCSNELIGRQLPDCDLSEVTSEIALQAQAVPTATVGPCVEELEPGWEYEHQQAESGLARFWLSSDRMGEHFVEVRLQPSCDPGTAIHRPSPQPGIEAFLTGSPYIEPVGITIVPGNPGVVDYAAAVGVALSAETAAGHPFDLALADAGDPSAEVAEAAQRDRTVITVDDADAREQTMGLILPGGEREDALTLAQAVDEISDHVDEPEYRADWFFVFEGGCIIWDFDAKGEMVANVDEDVRRALGFYDLAGLRRTMAELGYYTGP
jgi:hypothetical protein